MGAAMSGTSSRDGQRTTPDDRARVLRKHEKWPLGLLWKVIRVVRVIRPLSGRAGWEGTTDGTPARTTADKARVTIRRFPWDVLA